MDMRSTLAILLAAVPGCDSGAGARPQAAADSTARSASDGSPDSWMVRLDGIGPLRYGMRVAEVRVALRDTLGPLPAGDCVYLVPAAAPVGVRLMLEGGRMVRVDVDSAGIRTVAGGEVGLREADLRTRYPTLEVRPHKYDPAGRYLIYREHADSSRRLVFETDGQRVVNFRGGVMPAVEYVEGCS